MFNGKLKAITFSYDDGVRQDIKFIELLNKYNLKATFNLNSSLMGLPGTLERNGMTIAHNKIKAEDVKSIYQGHEVAVHTLTHPNLTMLEDSVVTRQVEMDRIVLSELVGYEVVGMAYPCGGTNNDERVAKVISSTTGVKYSRTITSAYNFDLQSDMYRFNPSVYHTDTKKLFEMGENFIKMKTDKPQLFYIWGHTYELDYGFGTDWNAIEEFFELISNREDIYYGTNKDVFGIK